MCLLFFLPFAGGCGTEARTPPSVSIIRIGTPMQVRRANPVSDYSYNIFAMLATHDTLVRFDDGMNPLPQLAESWETSGDGMTWRFRIHSGALWHDGKPVTPEDVKFTFEYLAARQASATWIGTLIREIRIDGREITFFLTKPDSMFLINGGFIVRILPKHVWQNIEDPMKPGETGAVAIGCGPYRLERFDPQGAMLHFRKNEEYYGNSGEVDRLEIRLNMTFDTLALSLIRGDIDLYYKYASGFPEAYLSRLLREKTLKFPKADAMGVPAALGFNLKHYPVSRKDFRKAIVSALDYGQIGRSLLGESAIAPTAGFVPPSLPYHLAMPTLAYAPKEGQRILDTAGFNESSVRNRRLSDGTHIILTLLARSDLEGTDPLLPIITHNLGELGITLNIEKADLSTWITRVREGDYDLVLFRTTPWGMLMDAGGGCGYFDARRSGGGTLCNVDDPVFNDICDQVLKTTEPAMQRELYHRMQRYYAEHLPGVALCWSINTYPVSNRWKNIAINQIEGGLLNRQTLANLAPVSAGGVPAKAP